MPRSQVVLMQARRLIFLNNLPPRLFKSFLESPHHFPAKGVIDGDDCDSLVAQGLVDPFPKGMGWLTGGPPGPHHPLGWLALRQVIGGNDRIEHGYLVLV